MADTQIIGATLTVNSEEAVKNVLKLKGTVADLKKEFKNAKDGSDEPLTALKKLKAAEEISEEVDTHAFGTPLNAQDFFNEFKRTCFKNLEEIKQMLVKQSRHVNNAEEVNTLIALEQKIKESLLLIDKKAIIK